MLLGAFNTLAQNSRAETGTPTSSGPNTNDWVIESGDDVTRTSETITLNSNLFVNGILRLTSVNLYFSCKQDGLNGLYIQEGGALYADQCTISFAPDTSNRFKFEVHGQLQLTGSTIFGAWADLTNRVGGIQVYSDEVSIRSCTIRDMDIGIYVNRATPTISENTISNCEYGIISDSEAVQSPPDFVLTDSGITFSEDEPVAGTQVWISADVSNIGSRAAIATVRFYDGDPSLGNLISHEQTGWILGGLGSTFNVPWIAVSGDHDIHVVVNMNRAVKEVSYSNNAGEKSIRPLFKVKVQGIVPDIESPYIFTIPQVPVYAFKPSGEYTNVHGTTDSNGKVLLSLPSGSYKFRTDYLGYSFGLLGDAPMAQIPSESELTISIESKGVPVTLLPTFGSEVLSIPLKAPIYVYTPDGAYVGLSKVSNPSNSESFVLPIRPYKFRADYLGSESWSSPSTGVPLEIVIPIAKAKVTVKQDTDVLPNINVYVFNSAGAYLGITEVTKTDGTFEFTLAESDFKFRADYCGNQYWSPVTSLPRSVITDAEINTDGDWVSVTLQKDDNTLLSGFSIYAFTEGGSYISMTDVTDENGIAEFKLPSGNFKFRADYLGYQYWSSAITVPDVIASTITIDHVPVTAKVSKKLDQTVSVLGNIPVYVFMPDGSYTGIHGSTDSAGEAEFDLPDGQDYTFRADYLGEQYWSDIFTVSDSLTEEIQIEHYSVEIQVVKDIDGVKTSMPGVTVYVFSSYHTYLGLSGITGNDGKFVFEIPAQVYNFRADYDGAQYWCSDKTIKQDCSIEFELIAEGQGRAATEFSYTLKKGDGTPMSSINVYVFTSANVYTGISGSTDTNGAKTFNLNDGTYKFRADYMGNQFWSSEFTVPDATSLNQVIVHHTATVSVQKLYNQAATPMVGINAYLFTSGGSYMSRTGTSDANGNVAFSVPEKAYKVRFDYLGYQFWSSDFTISQDQTIETDIEHRDVNIQVLREYQTTQTAVSGVPVYLYTPGAAYLGRSAVTDSNGFVQFQLPSKAYMFRTDYMTSQFWSQSITWEDSAIVIHEAIVEVTVLETDTPLANVNVYVFNGAGSYLSRTGATNAVGKVEFQLPAGKTFKFMADYSANQYWSGLVTPTADIVNPVEINTNGGLLTFTLQKDASHAISGINVYSFSAGGGYLGIVKVTDGSGIASFRLPAGSYKLRSDYLGYEFWTDVFAIPTINSLTYTIAHQDLTVTVHRAYSGTNSDVANAPVYLHKESGSYMGVQKTTGSDGTCVFNVPQKAYTFRADFMSQQYWGGPSTWTGTEIIIPEGMLEVTFREGTILHDGVTAYLFTDGGSYLNINTLTDANGKATFQVPVGSYKVRVDYDGMQYWTDTMTVITDQSTTFTIDIAPDLSATLSFDPATGYAGEYISISADIINSGQSACDGFTVRFYNGDPLQGGTQIGIDEPVSGLEAGSTSTVTITWMSTVVGDFEIYAEIDVLNEVDEKDETDNAVHDTLTLTVENRFPQLSDNKITNCKKGIYLDHSSLTIQGANIEGCDYGVYCVASDAVIQDSSISASKVAAIFGMTDSNVVLKDSSNGRSQMSLEDTSTVQVFWHLILTVVDTGENPVEGADVEIAKLDDTVEFSGSTNAEGTFEEILLEEFSEDALGRTYSSPYYLTVTYNGAENLLWLDMTAKKEMKVYVGGDSDNDGLTDAQENSASIFPMEAESLALEAAQTISDDAASGGKAVQKTSASTVILDSLATFAPAGTYKLYIRAKADPAGSRLGIDVKVGDTLTVDGETHKISTDYRWFSTISPDISAAGTSKISIKLLDLDADTSAKVIVDRLMLVRLKDASGAVLCVGGQITDPSLPDTDFDGLSDADEVRDEIYWSEAEDSPCQQTIVDDVDASNGKAVSLLNANTITIPAPAKQPANGEYQYMVRARSEASGSGITTKLESEHLHVRDIAWRHDGSYALITTYDDEKQEGSVLKYDGTTFTNLPLFSRKDTENADFLKTGAQLNSVIVDGGSIKLDLAQQAYNGVYTSEPITNPYPIRTVKVSWVATESVGQDIKVYIYNSADWVEVENGASIDSFPPTYSTLMYKVELLTSDLASTPSLDEITLEFNADIQLYAVAWSPDDSQAVITTGNGCVFIYDSVTGALSESDMGTNAAIYDAAYRPDGQLIAMVGEFALNYGNIILFNPIGGTLEYDETSVQIKLNALAWSPDLDPINPGYQGWLLIVGDGGLIFRWNDIHQMAAITSGTVLDLNGVAWANDGTQALIVGDDETILKVTNPVLPAEIMNGGITAPDKPDYNAIAITPLTTGAAVDSLIAGEQGLLLRYQDDTLSTIFTGTPSSFDSGGYNEWRRILRWTSPRNGHPVHPAAEAHIDAHRRPGFRSGIGLSAVGNVQLVFIRPVHDGRSGHPAGLFGHRSHHFEG
jgi:parallel beta-helix repeat protein